MISRLERNTEKLESLVEKLEKIADTIDSILPKTYDFKTRFILSDRIEIATKLYDTILKYRSELAKEYLMIEKAKSSGEDAEELRDLANSMSREDILSILKEFDVEQKSEPSHSLVD